MVLHSQSGQRLCFDGEEIDKKWVQTPPKLSNLILALLFDCQVWVH